MSLVGQWKARLAALPEQLLFSRFPIDSRTVFHLTESTFAFTNLKPVIPGHVLVSPRRVVSRVSDLSAKEAEDLFSCARVVGSAILKAHPHADSLTFTVQDGPSAGQTVRHVHIHVMPRWSTDRFNSSRLGNDAVYGEVERSEATYGEESQKMDEAEGSESRSKESMIEEGMHLREIIADLLVE